MYAYVLYAYLNVFFFFIYIHKYLFVLNKHKLKMLEFDKDIIILDVSLEYYLVYLNGICHFVIYYSTVSLN